MKGVQKYLKDTCDKKLWKGEPLTFVDLNDTKACAEALLKDLEGLNDLRSSKFEEMVKPAFRKFDKDGNGTIDIEELEKLSMELGQPLNEEQLEVAMKDLDLNGDGVIDEYEFARWYFTGMKSYSGTTRSLLAMRNQTSTIFDVLAKEDILKILQENKTMTKHSVKVQFNEPQEAYFAEMIYHCLGPYTSKVSAEADQYVSELGGALAESAGSKNLHGYVCMDIAMKPGQLAKYQELCTKLQGTWDKINALIPGPPHNPQVIVKFVAADDKISIKVLLVIPESLAQMAMKGIDIPVGLKEGLKDLDQYVKVKAVIGANAEEILTSDKALFEHCMKGFSVQVDVVFLK